MWGNRHLENCNWLGNRGRLHNDIKNEFAALATEVCLHPFIEPRRFVFGLRDDQGPPARREWTSHFTDITVRDTRSAPGLNDPADTPLYTAQLAEKDKSDKYGKRACITSVRLPGNCFPIMTKLDLGLLKVRDMNIRLLEARYGDTILSEGDTDE